MTQPRDHEQTQFHQQLASKTFADSKNRFEFENVIGSPVLPSTNQRQVNGSLFKSGVSTYKNSAFTSVLFVTPPKLGQLDTSTTGSLARTAVTIELNGPN